MTRRTALLGHALLLNHRRVPLALPSPQVLQLAVCVLTNPSTMKDDEADQTRALLRRIALLAEWMPLVRSACDCSFVLWSRELIPALIAQVYRGPPTEAARLQYLLAAASDATPYLLAAAHDDDDDADAAAMAAGDGGGAQPPPQKQRHLKAFRRVLCV